MQAYCTQCGNALAPAARFCTGCGAQTPAAGYAPFVAPMPARLVRPLQGRQMAGVCAAFARSYGWDLALVRILTVVLGIFVFPITEIVYVAAWIAIPDEANLPPM